MPSISPDMLAALADQAHLHIFLLGSFDDGLPLLWINEAATAKAGIDTNTQAPDPAPGLPSLGPIEVVLAEPVSAAQTIVPLLTAGKAGEFTVLCNAADGSQWWSHVTLTPHCAEPGKVTHWFGVSVDVTDFIDERSAQLQVLANERRERDELDLIARITELLGDLESPGTLKAISDLLLRVVSWAGFFIDDGGLVYTETIDPNLSPRLRGRRKAQSATAAPAANAQESHSDFFCLIDSAASSADPNPAAPPQSDPVRELLDGHIDGPVLVWRNVAYAADSETFSLCNEVERRIIADTGLRPASLAIHALGGRRQVLGLLVTWNGDQAGVKASSDGLKTTLTMPDDVRTVVEVIARRAGTTIDNARLHAREHRLAEALQGAMLPEQAQVTGLDVWTYYAPNAEHAQVGGDWYDVLDMEDFVVGIVIGDVVGHDVEAAAAMGQLRSVVRAYAFELTSPSVVLDRVDHLLGGMRIPRAASLVYAALRPTMDADFDERSEEHGAAAGSDLTADAARAASWSMEYSRAGHLPPLLLRGGKVERLDGAPGSLIGFGRSARATATVLLQPGDLLLFYTDGLIERRDRSLKIGLDALIAALAHVSAPDAAGVGEELLSRLADAPEDDIAIVVVRIPDPLAATSELTPSPRARRWVLPSDPASIGRARHAVLRSCEAWGISDFVAAELVVSELVANGVLHGWGDIALRLFDTGDGLRIEVEDANPAPPVTIDGHPNRVGGFGMQIVERLADWGWHPSGSGKLVWAKVRSANRE